ncbi:MAG: SH3 domain-containing protein [Anaerolineae bacterium]|nr:SH3 domain-containing protein [Anaerolineae bacterium]
MNRKHILLIGLVFALFFVAVVPALAQSATPQPTAPALTASTEFFATANFRLNVRSGPGVVYTVIGQLKLGDSVDITGRGPNNSWVRINFNGQEGWVSFGLVEISGDIDSAPEAEAGASAVLRETPAEANAEKLGTVIVITRLNSNLREGFSTDAKVLATIPFGTQLTVTARTERNNWVRVTYNGQTGWVSSGVLRFTQGILSSLPFINADGQEVQPSAQPEATPSP